MMHSTRKFFHTVDKLGIDISNDHTWSQIADYIASTLSNKKQIAFWQEAEAEFITRERIARKLFHKGQIYFRLSLLYLTNKTLGQCIASLESAKAEDFRTYNSEDTAAYNLYRIIKPLVNILNENDTRSIFNALSKQEDEGFFNVLKSCHDYCALGQIYQITLSPNEWTFIEDDEIRKIIPNLYYESLTVLANRTSFVTFYSVVFNLGCIVDGFIDDIFCRNSAELWNKFATNTAIQAKYQNKNDSYPLKQQHYPAWTTLDKKIEAIEQLAANNVKSVTNSKILEMRIINNYRNLIHLENIRKRNYPVNFYIANFLFTFIAHIAHDLWPENFGGSVI